MVIKDIQGKELKVGDRVAIPVIHLHSSAGIATGVITKIEDPSIAKKDTVFHFVTVQLDDYAAEAHGRTTVSNMQIENGTIESPSSRSHCRRMWKILKLDS